MHVPGSPDMPTGYARVTADMIIRLIGLGHDVAISATAGIMSHRSSWRGVQVYPCTPYADFGEDVVEGHYRDFKADLVITILCTWILKYPDVWRNLRTIHITPVDCEPMSVQDYQVICDTGGTPAAVTRFGLAQMKARGLADPLYLPHGVDTRIFKPPADRASLRDAIGVTDRFVIGLNFMNNDRERKAIFQQFKAFAKFHARHPDALLAVHAIKILPEGFNLPQLADHLGLQGAVMFSPQYELVTGAIPPEAVADWYGMCDVVTNVGNEGFGLPFIEAQACGTPVVYGGWGTGPEVVGAGFRVKGQEHWNRVHAAEWHVPFIASIVQAYERAYTQAAALRGKARAAAMAWDADQVCADYWGPVLASLD